MKIAHLTDTHFNFLPHHAIREFGTQVAEEYPDAHSAVISGDITECPYIEDNIKEFQAGLNKPVFFVLGNHDYYRGSFKAAEDAARAVNKKRATTWLSLPAFVRLTDKSCLVGQEGFYDARCGLKEKTDLMMSDFGLIEDFVLPATMYSSRMSRPHNQRIEIMRERADQEALQAYNKLVNACEAGFSNILFATHYPPFLKACFHENSISDGSWAPYFTSIAMGRSLEKAAQEYPKTRITVLCGHTHSPGEYEHLPNLKVLVGRSAYYHPQVSRVVRMP